MTGIWYHLRKAYHRWQLRRFTTPLEPLHLHTEHDKWLLWCEWGHKHGEQHLWCVTCHKMYCVADLPLRQAHHQ